MAQSRPEQVATAQARAEVPADLVALGVVRGAYGVKGWARIEPYLQQATVLLACRNWWLQMANRAATLELSGVRRHGALLLAKWEGCDTPEAADALKGAQVAVSRALFPPLQPGEYYWVDLLGARVINRAGRQLGRVWRVHNNGAQDLIEVEGGGTEILIPLVEQYVDSVDVQIGELHVDWEADW